MILQQSFIQHSLTIFLCSLFFPNPQMTHTHTSDLFLITAHTQCVLRIQTQPIPTNKFMAWALPSQKWSPWQPTTSALSIIITITIQTVCTCTYGSTHVHTHMQTVHMYVHTYIHVCIRGTLSLISHTIRSVISDKESACLKSNSQWKVLFFYPYTWLGRFIHANLAGLNWIVLVYIHKIYIRRDTDFNNMNPDSNLDGQLR